MQLRRAPILPATVNSEARSVDVVFTTGAAVRRRRWTGWDTSVPFDEILEVSDRAVDLTRLNAGAPALDSHSVWSSHSQVGVVERAWIEGKEGKATIRFPREGLDQAADRMFGLISDGIIRNVSVGYSIERVKVVEPAAKGEVEQRIVERWTPLEVSFVTVPADPRAQVRAADQASYPVEIIDTRMQKEASMPESTTTVAGDVPALTETRHQPVAAPAQPEQTAARMPEPAPAPDSETIATRAREAERDRVSTIYDLTGRLNLERSFAEDLVKRGVSVDESRRLILDQVAAKSDETRTFPHVSIPLGGRDERITRRDAVANALLHRYSPTLFPLEDAARQYRGMTLLELARESLGNAGVNTRGLSRDEVATRALHSTSDFPEILSAVTNKTLRQAYDAYPRTFALFCRQVLATDFKSMHRVQLGEAPQLLEVGESGEFKRGTLGESKESYKVKTYGRVVAITRQVLINDDLDAFTRIPAMYGNSIAQLESDVVWGIITSNPAMADGNALFHTTHKNLAGTGAALDVASVGAARAAMALQSGLDKKTVLNIRPAFLIVPAALELKAEQLVAQNLVPTDSAKVVPQSIRTLSPISEPRLDAASATSWYLAASPNQIDTIEYAYLEGQQGAYIETRNGFDVDGVEIKCRLDFGAKAIDWRGLYKNPGA
ncbi:Mu-like prophage major head subunit gpT family protein [Rhodobacteraceae bacterium HSP-20]|uniref:Mu-like prophage major head subunit gpT family protein n=2 Tax=Paragemmobacter amnigenus TaxID=2852097 RepID=A0ABS6J6G1_9RHOB|nr:Mu-like prophage major head subunit gpT family protein [Rhodobacter amnigenus]MBV4390570.1 Mu-like prophage major head subunit gpT family protein [Rhodobacter amnigenus]